MRTPTPNVDLRPDHWSIVRSALQRHVPDREVLAFGSRATWTAKDYSDLDLAIMGEEPLPLQTASALAEVLGDSDLPFKVDVVDWARTDDGFRRIIRRHGVVVQAPSQASGETPPSLPTLRGTAERRESRDGAHTPKRPEHRLGDIVDLNWGDTKTTKKSYTSVGFPAYSATGQDGLLPYYDFDRTGVVLSTIGAKCGRTWLAKGKWSCIKNTIRFWSTSPDADTEYLYWLTRDPNFWPKRSSAQAFISQGDARAIRIALPGIDEQRAIAHILGTLDDKIELNRRMNATLEAMARALFKSWFVDFDPVRAKMEGRDTGLPKDIADLFLDRMVDSEMGEIPEGWEVTVLTEWIDVNPRRSLIKGQAAPYLPMAKMPTHGHMPDSVAIRSFGSGMRFANGDTLVAQITPCLENGKTAYVDFLADGEIGWGSTEYIVLRPQPPLPNHFAYCLARSVRFREFAIQNMSGTSGRQRVPPTALREFLMVIPPRRLAARFGEVAGSLFERVSNVGHESRTLAALRDMLLPKLISGEIRVPDVERALESVT